MKENRQKRYYANARYNHTSEAYKYEYAPLYKPKTKAKIRKRKKEVYVKAEQGLKIYSFKMALLIIIGAIFVVSSVTIEALSVQGRFEIDSLNKTLAEIKDNNINLETKLAQNLDLEYIEKIAIEKLDMQKPSSHQIIHIDVPKESYSQKNDVPNTENFLSKIMSIFKK